ncbi:MAG: TrlF family AAA-like ATPase [Candidatus Omnitrophota bacterium]
MMAEWKWKGARWWKFDFHAHTPASNDYGKGPNQAQLKQITPKDWLLNYMRAGIDCIAIMDHNTGAWFKQLEEALSILDREKPDDYRQLSLFPGMEISVQGGIHVLTIFDTSKTTSDIDALRGSIGYRGTPGHCDGVTTKSFVDVVNEIVSAGGIAIPAHVDEDNGLFQQKGTTLAQELECDQIYAMELINPAFPKPQIYNDKKLSWTEVLGTDAHHPTGNDGQQYPGSRFTWVKMEEPDIEGLRLALLDGALSIKRSDQVTGDPNQHADLAIEEINVSMAKYLGRVNPFALQLNPWLNAIIGGRGTGKSTLVEFCRIALRREKELPEDLEIEFKKYSNVYSSREDFGLLTEETEIIVVYRKNGTKFRIQWSTNGNLEPIQEYINDEWRRAAGEIQHRFPVRIYSQKQIFHLAKTPLALLKVVDEAPEVDYRLWNERWHEEEARFLSLRAKAREIEAGLSEEPRLLGELDDVKRKLTVFEEAGHAGVLKDYQKRSRQQRVVELWSESLADIGDRLREVAGDIVPDELDESAFDIQLPEDGELKDLAASTKRRIDEIRKKLEELALEADHAVAEWQKNKDQSKWKQDVNKAVGDYEYLRKKLEEEGAGDPSAYGELVQRRHTIEQRLQNLQERKNQVNDLRNESKASLSRLLEIRRSLTELRRSFLESVLTDNRYVRIEVIPFGAKETIEEEFRRIIQKESEEFKKDIEGLLDNLLMNSSSSSQREEFLNNIKQHIHAIYTDASGFIEVKDARFKKHIKNLLPEAIDRLDLWFPEDSLEVQYSATADGQRFRSIQEGSPGQKTAALLAFLLSYGKEPLILDQPEDDLDNHLIYDLIVTQLREIKQNRQVIVVTHNANIVVNGDAELVCALEARGGESQKECEGSLQKKKVRNTICGIMEGGLEAFKRRYRRIALEKFNV